MPFHIEILETGEDYDPKDHDTKRVTRRAYCDGCGTGTTYKPEQWVYGPEQVASWFEEHKDHGAKGKKK